MISKILNVFGKERKDTFRDRRTVFAALAYSFLGPALLVVVLNFLATQATDETATKISLLGGDNAPNLVEPVESDDSPQDLIGSSNALLIIDENFQRDIAQGLKGRATLYVDRTNYKNSSRANRVRGLINQFAGGLSDARLLALGVPPSLVQPMHLETKDLSSAGATAKTISFLLIYFFVLAPFFSSLSVSIDTTAGERERKSLQTLLAQPVSTSELVIGKWLIGVLFGVTGTLITVFGGLTALGYTPIEVLGIKLNFGLDAQIAMLISLVPLALMVAALQILVSLSAKSYKEANTYLQLISFAPVIVGLTLSLSGRQIEGALSYMPVISHLQNTQFALLEGGIELTAVLISGAICLALTVLCLFLAAKRLKSESILSAA
jgi:sodium transport system permease protein